MQHKNRTLQIDVHGEAFQTIIVLEAIHVVYRPSFTTVIIPEKRASLPRGSVIENTVGIQIQAPTPGQRQTWQC